MISAATQVLAVFGNPVKHSLSPQMHAGWIADHGIDATYIALEVHRDHALDTFRAMRRLGLTGANVTVPFKEEAMQAADVCTEDVAALGVANTLVWRNGAIHAHNTDWGGTRAAIDEAVPDWIAHARRAVLVGAGGAARAVAYGLMRRGGPDMIVVNRTREKADDLARFLKQYGAAEARDWSALPAAIAEADVIVNASTLGMKEAPAFDWPLERARPEAIVFDAVYAKGGTPLVKQARAQGLRAVDGLDMLVHQGAIAFDIWFGVKPDTRLARERVDAIMAARA